MSYALLSVAAAMFGVQFFFNQQYVKIQGNSEKAAMKFIFGEYIAGAFILFAINKFKFEFTFFTLIVAVFAALDLFGYTIFSMKALGKVNLSLFSVFAMLGGMVLPFIDGIVFYNEGLTSGKIICLGLIGISLFVSTGHNKDKSGIKYCMGAFLFNGLYGVIAKFFSSAEFEKTSEAAYSVMIALVVVVLSSAILFFMKEPKLKRSSKAFSMAASCGAIGCTANFFILLAIKNIDVSLESPFITGGVMIISTIICFFTPIKPTKREIASVAIAFVGLLALVVL